MKTKQYCCFVLALLTLCFFLATTGCGDDSESTSSGDIAATNLNCEANWDSMAGADGRLIQTISVTFRVPDEYAGPEPPDSPFTVGGAITPNAGVPVMNTPIGNCFMDKTALLVAGEEYTYTTTFVDRFQTQREICGEYYYMSVALYYYEMSFPVAAEWAWVSEFKYEFGGDEIVITGAEMANNLLRDN